VTIHVLSGRGLYVFTYDDEADLLTTSQPGGLEQVTRWETYEKGVWFDPYPRDCPDIEVGVSDTTYGVREEYGDTPKEVAGILQHAIRLHKASRYHLWDYGETVAYTSTDRRLDLGAFNVLRHGMQALIDAGFWRPAGIWVSLAARNPGRRTVPPCCQAAEGAPNVSPGIWWEDEGLSSEHRRGWTLLDEVDDVKMLGRFKNVTKCPFCGAELPKDPNKLVEIAECNYCGCLTLNPSDDVCGCGEELYPVTKTVAPGTRIKGTLLPT